MGRAIETVMASAVNPGAGGAVGVFTLSGDTGQVRSFDPPARASLLSLIRMGTTAGFAGVRSPLLHDADTGNRFTPAESPSVYSLPGWIGQDLTSQDTLTFDISGGAAETDLELATIYYDNVGGATARLFSPSDIMGNVENLKPQRVAVTSSATAGVWVDTPLGTTENLLHANTDYAILGYTASVALAAVGIKGIETGNLRICGPGSTQEYPTTDYFWQMSVRTNKPCIPVVNAANIGGLFVPCAAATASVAATVELYLAELTNNLPKS
jgi:hypothetical protein